jgi:general stress protein 26
VRRHENAIYFFTDRGAQKDDEIARFPEVCIAFADPSGQTYVSVCGRAQIVQDRAKLKELWSLPAKAWWGDPDNPNLLLVKVSPTEAEFWDPPGNVLSSLRVAFALAKGGPPPHPPHEHRHVSLP